MSIDYIVSSLQPLAFDGPAPCTWEQFRAILPAEMVASDGAIVFSARWQELETQLRNAMATAITNYINGGDLATELATAEDTVNFAIEMLG